MKVLYTKISAMLMAMVVLLSTMSFSVNMHYCMEMLVDVSYVLPADSCGMDMDVAAAKEGLQITSKPCCSDEHIAFEGQDEVQLSSEWAPEEMPLLTATFLYSYSLLFTEEPSNSAPFREYQPPAITKDLPVIYETFLI